MLPDPMITPTIHDQTGTPPEGWVESGILEQGITWVLTGWDKSGTVRERSGYRLEQGATPISEPLYLPTQLKISHQTVGKGVAVRDRYLIRFETESRDPDGLTGTTEPLIMYTVVDLPRRNITSEMLQYCYEALVGILYGKNLPDLATCQGLESNADWSESVGYDATVPILRIIGSHEA